MGNRAVIAFNNYSDKSEGMYLHWNGGKDSILGMCAAANEIASICSAITPKEALIQVVEKFTGKTRKTDSDRFAPCKNLDCDNYDNGVYVVDEKTLIITGRFFEPKREQSVYDLVEFKNEVLEMFCE